MGVDYTLMVGRFIKNTSMANVFYTEKEVKVCKNKDCSRYMVPSSGKYCSECGEPLKKHKKKITEDINDAIEDELIKMGKSDWVDMFYVDERPAVIVVEGMYASCEPGQILEHAEIPENELFLTIKKILKEAGIRFKDVHGSYISVW
jgi:hypothetical protein